MDEKEKFAVEFYKTCDLIVSNYQNKEEQEKEIIGFIINTFLHQVQCDIEKMQFREFYKKYLGGTLFLDCYDFTKSEIETIINESPLNDRDRKLATLYWLDMKSEDDIAYKLCIDRKTVRNNIPKISMILKQTCSKLFK